MGELITWDDISFLMDDLRQTARGLLRLEGNAQTLTPTALVLTALRRQVPQGKDWKEVDWKNRAYFFGAMYTAMRRALIDHAAARNAAKRLRIKPIAIDDLHLGNLTCPAKDHPEEVAAVLLAVDRLRTKHPEWAEVVEHRYLAGYTIEETARVMDKGEKTIRRWWEERIRPLLYVEVLRILNEGDGGDTQ